MNEPLWRYSLRSGVGGILAVFFTCLTVTAFSEKLLETKWGLKLQGKNQYKEEFYKGGQIGYFIADGKLSIAEVKSVICDGESFTSLCDVDDNIALITPNHPYKLYKAFETTYLDYKK